MQDQSVSPLRRVGKRNGFLPGFLRCRMLLIGLLLLVLGGATPLASANRTVHIYASKHSSSSSSSNDPNAAVARKQQHDLQQLASQTTSGGVQVQLHYLTREEQMTFVQEHCPAAVSLWNDWESAPHLQNWQTEIFKWCALSSHPGAAQGGNDEANTIQVWMDSQSPILVSSELLKLWNAGGNVAVLDQEQRSNTNEPIVHGSYLQIANNENTLVPRRMLELLLQDPEMAQLLPVHGLLIPRQTYRWIQADEDTVNWTFLNLSCRDRKAKTDKHLECAKGYCCSIQSDLATLLMSRHLVLPQQTLPAPHLLPRPLNASERTSDDPFISTISVQHLDTGTSDTTILTFYDWLHGQHALPSDGACSKCLREKNGANCHTCAKPCATYCQHLCHSTTTEHIVPPPVVAEWTVTLPQYSRDPERLVPRLVHQTWMEELEAARYPNMSRMAQSFRKAGWTYHFWSDADATTFLQTHFPPPVLEAYQALKPGAFKADLFRYCVLLIMGGVYADVDIQLESVLDLSIPPDVGFMVPVDEPGKPVGKQMCVWNGFIAAAPGHPFLAKAIETVVNQVRNRFTSVDVDATFCPDPELSVLHAYDTLFTAGPCLLGASINRVLGRNGQTSHIPGEIHGLWSGEQREHTEQGTSFVLVDEAALLPHRLPGRTIILHQNKWDMGAHRFTFLEQNLVVAATDLPDSNDREHLEGGNGGAAAEHYSKAHAKVGVYGVEHLYVDQKRAGESIRIVIDARLYAKKQVTAVA